MGGLRIGVLFWIEALGILCMIGLGYFGYKTGLGELSISTVFICDKWIAMFHMLRSCSTLYNPSGSSGRSIVSDLRRLSSIHIWASRDVQDQSQWFKYSIAIHKPSVSGPTRLHKKQNGLGILSQSSIHPHMYAQLVYFVYLITSSERTTSCH
jgi:hypothetical protein